jgi:hypothetical protein
MAITPLESKHMTAPTFNTSAIATDLTWQNIDPASLPAPLAKLYASYRAEYERAKQAREAFEQAFRSAIVAPSGTEAVLGYRFGKLSFAFAPLKVRAAARNLVDFAKLARK